MKNLFMAGFFLLVMGAVAFASPQRMQVGVTGLYDHYNYTVSSSGVSFTDDRNNLVIGAFFDAIYARFIAEYQTMLSGTQSLAGISADYPSNSSISFVNLIALGKYPFQLGTTALWPAIGIRYSIPLTYTVSGTNYLSNSNADVADLYVCLGGGVDFALGSVIVGLSAFYDLSLTPNQTKTAPAAGISLTGFDLELSLNVGFAL